MFSVIVLVAGMVLGFTFFKKEVYLVQNGQEVRYKTSCKKVGDFLTEKNITPGPEQLVIPRINTRIEDGMTVEIRSKNTIILTADKNRWEFTSMAGTVGEVLSERKLVLGPQDIVIPNIEHRIGKDTEIKVIRVLNKVEEKNIILPHSTESVNNSSIPSGVSKTVIGGENGQELQKWSVVYHDGKEAIRQLIEKQIIREPKKALVHVGTGQAMVSRGGQTFRYRKVLDAVASAYTYTGSNTATGIKPAHGVVAVDTRVIPLGTRLYIDGYGYATAMDTGGSIKGNRIDVFLESLSSARSWGIKRVKVYVLE